MQSVVQLWLGFILKLANHWSLGAGGCLLMD